MLVSISFIRTRVWVGTLHVTSQKMFVAFTQPGPSQPPREGPGAVDATNCPDLSWWTVETGDQVGLTESTGDPTKNVEIETIEISRWIWWIRQIQLTKFYVGSTKRLLSYLSSLS